ncbi:FeoB-associated Cys-rich membrane protein [Amphritea pacifica]|uniref:FeoB-associated Cys-rich membrane protein n=1 Tax=Amphritea pacifica TaxID=2811233 RepID=A0ABS2WBR2_9GAMM|nr:FeoB-associated Cys-rich membrane protein [Amphritea pacifica]MBN0989040.1 FeoB-associated Cys-rich membrane protein [Amphritea pacifica]MBN1008046.1 FeoB-associated Cys-rich membrane protein [Amphritea pacifica]
MTVFDWIVLVAVVALVGLWFCRYLYRTFNKKCSGGGCSNCSGCGVNDRPSSKPR